MTELEKMLYRALFEAACWIPWGEGLTPAQRGAKCSTLTDVASVVVGALSMAEKKYGTRED